MGNGPDEKDDLQEREYDYAKLVLRNIHDSLKWIFSVIIGGAAIRGAYELLSAGILQSWPQDIWRTYAVFLVFSFVIFRFYWGWVRYLDVKYLETPELILIKRKIYFKSKDKIGLENSQVAFRTALKCARPEQISADGGLIFLQTTIIYVLAGAISLKVDQLIHFSIVYAVLLIVNAFILEIVYIQQCLVPAYHRQALNDLFHKESKLVSLVAPDKIRVWVWNNLIFGFAIAVILTVSLLASWEEKWRDLILIGMMLLNSIIDFRVARVMYSRNAITLLKLFE